MQWGFRLYVSLADPGRGGGGSGGSNPHFLKNSVKGFNPKYKKYRFNLESGVKFTGNAPKSPSYGMSDVNPHLTSKLNPLLCSNFFMQSMTFLSIKKLLLLCASIHL